MLVLLNLAHRAHLVHAGQAQGQARLPGAPGAAHAVHMHFGVRGDVDINHRLQLINVQPARGHVRGHQHRATAVGKLRQHLVALALLQLAVQRQGVKAVLLQPVHQVFALLLGVAKG